MNMDSKPPPFPYYMKMSTSHYKTSQPIAEVVDVINDVCTELSICTEENNIYGKYVHQNWECSCFRDEACSFVINTFWYENEIAVEFRLMSGSRYAFSDILTEISARIGVNINNACTLPSAPVLEDNVLQEEDLGRTAAYALEMITASNDRSCLNGILVVSKILNERMAWHLGTIYETIIDKGHSADEEMAVTAIRCLNKYVNYLIFTKELACRMCSILERCRDTNPYHVKREALNFALTLSLKIPSTVRETGILSFARPNKKDSITSHYVSQLHSVLGFLG